MIGFTTQQKLEKGNNVSLNNSQKQVLLSLVKRTIRDLESCEKDLKISCRNAFDKSIPENKNSGYWFDVLNNRRTELRETKQEIKSLAGISKSLKSDLRTPQKTIHFTKSKK